MQEMDRISYLPDPIRSCIISFLPFKDAIRTKILSSRWKDMCASLSNLDFEQIQDRKDLKAIIDQTLILHDGSDISSFKLHLGYRADKIPPLHLNTWISFALNHNVSEISIQLRPRREVIEMFPSSLFTSSTITVLELSHCNLKLPSKVHFPYMKTLQLDAVTFCNDSQTCKLFSDSSFPMLETLMISYCLVDEFTILSISITSLKFVDIWDVDDDLHFNLSCPNLYEFFYEATKLPELTPDTLSSLFIATFQLLGPVPNLSLINNAEKILKGLINVRKLTLEGSYIEVLTMLQDLSLCLPTPYHCLQDLVLHVDVSQSQLQLITFILRSSPNLQNLHIYFNEGDEDVPSVVGNMQSQGFSNGDMLKNLTKVKFRNFQGSEFEVDLVRYLLENANILKQLDIEWSHSKHNNVESRMSISEKLLKFARISPHAQISTS